MTDGTHGVCLVVTSPFTTFVVAFDAGAFKQLIDPFRDPAHHVTDYVLAMNKQATSGIVVAGSDFMSALDRQNGH